MLFDARRLEATGENALLLIEQALPQLPRAEYFFSTMQVVFADLTPEVTALSTRKKDKMSKIATDLPQAGSQKVGKKEYKVAAISDNTNSFGLHGMVVMAEDGAAYQLGGNYLQVKRYPTGTIIVVKTVNGQPQWSTLGFEIPEQLPKAPAKLAKSLWKE